MTIDWRTPPKLLPDHPTGVARRGRFRVESTPGECSDANTIRSVIPERFAPVLRELAPLAERFRADGHRLYLVGGTVRDLLVADGKTDFDLDLTTDARPPEIKACLEGWADAIWTQGEKFGTIGANKRNDATGETRPYEITTFRAEAYTDESRKPVVVFADEIDADLSRRDFTVNAMALELTGDGDTPRARRPIRRCR